jgi:BirA family biotin operon repressor/biotin-[acetyl-CoA-carboxylase] ligase
MTQKQPTHEAALALLKSAAGDWISGPALAERLEVSRTAVWKAVRKLEGLGYRVESDAARGYRLEESPDRLLSEEILPLLHTRRLGRTWRYFPEIGSTNDRAMELAAAGAEHGTVVAADEQTAGRGRLDRRWLSPAGGGIYFSVLLRVALPVELAPQTTLVAGLALVRALADYPGVAATLKWPNDVLVRGNKVAGILTEMQSDLDRARFVVIGTGINVRQDFSEGGAGLHFPAGSLSQYADSRVDRRTLTARYLERFEEEFERFQKDGLGPAIPELEQVSAVVGRTVRVLAGGMELSGRVTAITREGALEVETSPGERRTIWSGEITRLRAGPETAS